MNLLFLLMLFAMLWLTIGMWAMSRKVQDKTRQQGTIEELLARIRTLEEIITDQDRKLRRDFDGL
ncbi:MAG: hypothetical protein AAF253_01220 [Pseudomonadota bacterium]